MSGDCSFTSCLVYSFSIVPITSGTLLVAVNNYLQSSKSVKQAGEKGKDGESCVEAC